MMVEKNIAQNSPGEHIGVLPHPKRNLLLGGGVVISAALIGLFYWCGGKSDVSAIEELHSFRQAMATQCKQEQFARPPVKGLEGLYVDSSRMQAVVHEQLGSLRRGQVSCEQIVKSLKSVDYPVD